MRNLYSILGVPRDADQATIKKRYKKLARENHPDLNKDPKAADRFKEINAAYEVLGDDQRRTLYEEFGEVSLKPGFNADQARQWKSMGGGRGGGMGGGFRDFGGGMNMDDVLGSLFGMGGGQTRGPRRRGPRKGADIESNLTVDLMDVVRGEQKVVELRRPTSCGSCRGQGGTGRSTCSTCRGSGRVRLAQLGGNLAVPCSDCGGSGAVFSSECEVCAGTGRTMDQLRLKIRLPAGVEDGQVVRLRGKGGDGEHGGPPGDLLLRVHVGSHPVLRREGADLFLEVPLTISEALEGGRIEVPTPDGAIRVNVPAGAASGQKLRLKGKGIEQKSGGRGHLYLVLRPTPPTTEDPEAARLAKELDQFYETPVREGLEL